MVKKGLFLILYIFSVYLSYAQITVNKTQLSGAINEKIMESISAEITSAIQNGEAYITDKSHFSIVLEPFEKFGIDPKDPKILNKSYEIYSRIQGEVKKDPTRKKGNLLKNEISSLITTGLKNYAGTIIDSESQLIIEEASSLLAEGEKKISDLLSAVTEISGFDPSSIDYESDVSATLKYFGVKSDYFYVIDDLDQVLSLGIDKVVDPLSALYTISSAMGSDDPIYKIEMLFELGETFGGKIPIIGDLVTPLFTLAKGVLNAAKRLENILEKNLNQGCINTEAGTYGGNKIGSKSYKFIKKFPKAGYVCPMTIGAYHPVYNNIYFSLDLEDIDETYFYLNNVWLLGKNDKFHKGVKDIYASIQWLRRNNHSEDATKLEFVYNSYQKEYGWVVYTEEVKKRIERIKQLFHYSYQTVHFCEDKKLEDFYMRKMQFNWLKNLLEIKNSNSTFGWNDFKYFESVEVLILNKMISNYYLSKHRTNFKRLDAIIENLENQMPVNITGKVLYENGNVIANAKLQVGTNSMFYKKDRDHKVITDSYGNYSYFLLMKIDKKIGMTVSAVTPDSEVLIEDITIEPGLRINARKKDLVFPDKVPDANTTSSQNPEDDSSNSANLNPTSYTKEDILANSDCSEWPNMEPKWDSDRKEAYCDCKDGYSWDEDLYKCITEQEELLNNSDCSQYLNAHAILDSVTQEVICDCLPGFDWHKNGTECVSKAFAVLQNKDCSQWPNMEPKWDSDRKEAYCDCKDGYSWDEELFACVQIVQQQQTTDLCVHIPNSRAVFDAGLNTSYCDCLPGYKWNKNQTGCILIPKKPTVNWDNVLSLTLGVLNAANQNNQGIIPSVSGNPGMEPATQHQSNCNDEQQAGGDPPEEHTIDLGTSYGNFNFDYNTYTQKDQIIITNGGVKIFDSGCVGERKSIQLSLRGISPTITVRINPNCEGGSGTSWDFTVHCPTN